MSFAAKDETLSPPMMGSGEKVFFLAAPLALLETHGVFLRITPMSAIPVC
jgi:hypothetical protein